jgi:hypothetical protein
MLLMSIIHCRDMTSIITTIDTHHVIAVHVVVMLYNYLSNFNIRAYGQG